MSKSSRFFLVATLCLVTSPTATPQQPQDQDATIGEEGATPAVPRVLGEARTEIELASWNSMSIAATAQEKIRLGQIFLTTYPDSGLSPYVRQEMALSYYNSKDFENFAKQAELALEELPSDIVLLSLLARYYAENEESNKAIQTARKGLQLIESTQQPSALSLRRWLEQLNQNKADLNYAEGLALYNSAMKMTGGNTAIFERASKSFEAAVEAEPTFDYAYYQMAVSYLKLNDADRAIENLARSAALEDLSADPARNLLSRVYEALKKEPEEINQIVEQQKNYIQQRVEQVQATIQERIDAETSQPPPALEQASPSLQDSPESSPPPN